MATFEDKEFLDYTVKKIQEVMKPENFVIKDLDKMYIRITKIENKMSRIVSRINNLDGRIRSLEKANLFRNSETSSESD